MANYQDWNNAIYKYIFNEDINNDTLFEINEETIKYIGRTLLKECEPKQSFCSCVLKEISEQKRNSSQYQIKLKKVDCNIKDNIPQQTAAIAFFILAASTMTDDKIYNSRAYWHKIPKLAENTIFKNIDEHIPQKDYDDCTVFWSAILIKGMEQSMTQMIIEKNSVVDELTALYRRDKNITEIMDKSSSYRRFEFFLLFYFLRSFWKTSELFDQIKEIKIKDISSLYIVITIVYIAITMILILIVRHVISNSRKVFNSFLNFIVILPAKFLGDDSYFLEEILKLEDKLY